MPLARTLLALVVIAAANLLFARALDAAPGETPTIVAQDPTRTAAAVALSDASITVMKGGDYGFFHVVCLGFVNHGPATATKVGFSLANVDATGTVVSVDALYPTGKFPVDKRSAFSGGSRMTALSANGNCHDTPIYHTPLRSVLDYKSRREAEVPVAAVLVSVREIVYDGLPAWRTDDVPKTGDHLPLPSPPPFAAAVPAGLPLVSAATVADSPLAVADAYAFAETRFPLGPPFGARRYACGSFASRDARALKRIAIAVELVARDGTIGVTNQVEAPAYPRNGVASACAELFGKYDADTFVYEWPGHSVPLGRVVVVPVSAEFSDGSKWRTPWFPQVGDAPTPPQ